MDFLNTCAASILYVSGFSDDLHGRNRPRVKILEDGRVSLYGELRKHAAEQ